MTALSTTEIKSYDTQAPDMVIPLARHISPAEFDLERERIFGKAWLMAAHASDVPSNGDYVTCSFHVPKASVLIVRGGDGVVRAFHNICRHRGNALVPEGSKGSKRRFSCSFHGWTWDSSGALQGITDQSQFVDIDKEALHLLPVHCEVWNGLVFLNFDAVPTVTLNEWLGELAGGYEDYFDKQHKLSSHRSSWRQTGTSG